MATFPITGFPYYPGLTKDDMLNLRFACSAAVDRWRNVNANDPDYDRETCYRIADEYNLLWERLYDAVATSEGSPRWRELHPEFAK